MPRRVRRPASYDALLDKLTDKEQAGIFETYKDAIVFAAALGAFNDQTESFEEISEPINYEIFRSRSDNEALIHLLAIYKTNDIQILSEDNSDERVKILEEYANAGFNIIEKKIKNSTTALDAILNLILETKEREQPEERDFSRIMDSIHES